MIYSHKPQRSGRSIPANTNNPPQDPPPPPTEKLIITNDVTSVPLDLQIPDIPINDTTPPVPESCVEEKPIITIPKKRISKSKQTPKKSLFRRFLAKLKSIFRRK